MFARTVTNASTTGNILSTWVPGDAVAQNTTISWAEASVATTPGSPEWAVDAVGALWHAAPDLFFQIVSSVSAPDDHVIRELLVVAESLVGVLEDLVASDSAQMGGQTAVDVFSVIGGLAADGLGEDEEKSYTTPGGIVLWVMAPSSGRALSGFALGPFSVPPLHDVHPENITVQAISWRTNLFHQPNVSATMLTFNVLRNKEYVALKRLAPPLQFYLDVNEKMAFSETDTSHVSCVFWNATSLNWSDQGVHVVRSNLTQVGMVVFGHLSGNNSQLPSTPCWHSTRSTPCHSLFTHCSIVQFSPRTQHPFGSSLRRSFSFGIPSNKACDAKESF